MRCSVGPRARNLPQDVRFVQSALNQISLCHYLLTEPLTEDGRFEPRIQDAILQFQIKVMRLKKADGAVDPNGATARQLDSLSKTSRPLHVVAFIRRLAGIARDVHLRWGVPASVVVAQVALESDWGRRAVENAFFGVKGKASTTGRSVSFGTHEVLNGKSEAVTDRFRAFDSLEEAADDYGRFLKTNPRYASCFTYSNDPLRFIQELAKAAYATDPDYEKKLKQIILQNGLAALDR